VEFHAFGKKRKKKTRNRNEEIKSRNSALVISSAKIRFADGGQADGNGQRYPIGIFLEADEDVSGGIFRTRCIRIPDGL